jgi:anaerobic selenocysteine-containing dehydrogenase
VSGGKITRREFARIVAGAGGIIALGSLLSNLATNQLFEVLAGGKGGGSGEIEDVKIPSVDLMCPVGCGILARRVNGRLVKIEGNPNHPINEGGLCPKGNSGIMTLYDPYRIKAPLKRTNPKKGRGEDPGWVEISWDEAIELVASKLREIRRRNPDAFVLLHGENQIPEFTAAFMSAFGSVNDVGRGSLSEAALDVADALTWGAPRHRVDVDNCNLLLLFGTGAAAESNSLFLWYARHIADARERGMKLVVIEPRLSNSAAVADEWIRINPGTDAALALAMINVLIEKGLVDYDFIKNATNGPYLVDVDSGYFLRRGGKPLIWDRRSSRAVPWDSEGADPALTGSYVADGKGCKPAFQMLREVVGRYTPEEAARITGVPADKIIELAEEFGRRAQIGSTVMLEGNVIPYRPVAADFYRGVCAHQHGALYSRAILLLNMMVGNIDAVGGLSVMSVGEGDEGSGMLKTPPYTIRFPPRRIDLSDSFYPLAYYGVRQQVTLSILQPERYQLPYRVEAMMIYYANPLLQTPGEELQIRAFEKVPFLFTIDCFMSETSEMADVILPDRTYLERFDLVPIYTPTHRGHALRQPVVEPLYNTRHAADILIDIAERAGFLYGEGGFNDHLNRQLGLRGGYKLNLNEKYTYEEILDRLCRSLYGDEYGLEWFKRYGVKAEALKPNQRYVRYRQNGRVYRMHLYSETIKEAGDALRKELERLGLGWWKSYQYYQPLPVYIEPSPHQVDPTFDLHLITYKLVEHTTSRTAQNPWLMELYGLGVPGLEKPGLLISRIDAERRNIRDGEEVWVESPSGKIRVRALVVEGIKPGVVALSTHFGHWAFNRYARGVGVNVNKLIPSGEDYIDPISGQQAFNDTKVRVYK